MHKDLDSVKKDLLTDLSQLSAQELTGKYLSKKGILTELFKNITNIKPEEKATYGKELNQIKQDLERTIATKKDSNQTVIESKKN